MNVKENKILYNAIKTPDGTILESLHRHDFKDHKDKNGKIYMIDGGNEYIRRSNNGDEIDISIWDDGKHETRRKYINWGVNYDKDMNRLPRTRWTPIKDLDDGHIHAILDGNHTNNEFYIDVFKSELDYRKINKNESIN